MSRFLASVLATGALTLSLLGTPQAEAPKGLSDEAWATAEASYVALAITDCIEDQPCWTWSTMGNLQRGTCFAGINTIEHADGRPLSVGGRGCYV